MKKKAALEILLCLMLPKDLLVGGAFLHIILNVVAGVRCPGLEHISRVTVRQSELSGGDGSHLPNARVGMIGMSLFHRCAGGNGIRAEVYQLMRQTKSIRNVSDLKLRHEQRRELFLGTGSADSTPL